MAIRFNSSRVKTT